MLEGLLGCFWSVKELSVITSLKCFWKTENGQRRKFVVGYKSGFGFPLSKSLLIIPAILARINDV